MDHSYEEIRAAALDILAGRETGLPYEVSQYANLGFGVAEVLARRQQIPRPSGRTASLSSNDADLYLEVFWNLFREGIITLGLNDSNREFPFFRLSRFGQKLVANQDTYFFHDVSTYSRLLQEQVPQIDNVTLLYLKEAVQAFRAGCILSSTVMLGVATEHTFGLLLEAVAQSATHAQAFASIHKERQLLARVNKFKAVLDTRSSQLSADIKEDLDTHFLGILSIIRTFRNESGHPTGKIVDREQTYVLLNLFVPYCKKMYQLMDYFR
jgi:hypothetical protein